MKNQNNLLLPSGFIDVLPDQAAHQSKVISKLLRNFELWGYSQVNPPMVEFENNSFHGNKTAKNSFRFMDNASTNMLEVRSDMTMQIARMAAVRLKDKPRPLRLSYSGEVLRIKGEGAYTERQLSQVGIEIVGDDSPASGAEVILSTIDVMTKAGIEDIFVDLSMPMMSTNIMEDMNVPKNIRAELFSLIEKKDTASIEKLCSSVDSTAHTVINKFISLAGPHQKVLSQCAQIPLSQQGSQYCLRLKEIVSLIVETQPDVKITIDPLERRNFEYHTGISFAFFSANSNEELGRGGRYLIKSPEDSSKSEPAVGLTLSVNAIERTLARPQKKQKILVPYGYDAKHLRDEGKIAINILSESENMEDVAKKYDCDFIYKDDKIVEV